MNKLLTILIVSTLFFSTGAFSQERGPNQDEINNRVTLYKSQIKTNQLNALIEQNQDLEARLLVTSQEYTKLLEESKKLKDELEKEKANKK